MTVFENFLHNTVLFGPACNHLSSCIYACQAQLLEAQKRIETLNKLYLKTKELLLASEQQVTTLQSKLTAASSSEAVGATCLKLQLRGKLIRAV